MHVLKDAAIESNKTWVMAGKPKHGPIFSLKAVMQITISEEVERERKTGD